MQKALTLVSLLVLTWTWTIQGLPVLPDPLYPTQENFDLTQFLGTWHDVAVATTCTHMHQHKADAAIGKLVLEAGDTEGKLKTTRTLLRHGTCKAMSGDYELTSIPGRFFYHIKRWASDVDAYVVHTNYNEFAIVIMSKERSSGEKSISLKLYSRTMSVRDSVLEDFKALVRQEGMSDDTIIIKQDKGDCVPEEQAEPSIQRETQRRKRNMPLMDEEEASGDAPISPINVTEACNTEPDAGPCFGLIPRFYYNSTSMSCESFNYGGCMGNQNNFLNERDCLQRCRTEAACRLPMIAKSCTGQPVIWAFDSTVGLCVSYKEGFCQTNGNKFYSKAECDEYCGTSNASEETDLLPVN